MTESAIVVSLACLPEKGSWLGVVQVVLWQRLLFAQHCWTGQLQYPLPAGGTAAGLSAVWCAVVLCQVCTGCFACTCLVRRYFRLSRATVANTPRVNTTFYWLWPKHRACSTLPTVHVWAVGHLLVVPWCELDWQPAVRQVSVRSRFQILAVGLGVNS